jgi:hypothetical protein
MGDPLQSVQIATYRRSSDCADGSVSHQEMINDKTKGGGEKGRKRKRGRDKHLKKVVGDVVGWRAEMVNCITNPYWSSIRKAAMKVNL